ncbi:ApeA N-terminal domain 1-containing protein [Micrococcus luteus]
MIDSELVNRLDGIQGEWWVAGCDARLPGTLHLDLEEHRWELKILGQLVPPSIRWSPARDKLPLTLHGATPVGPVTARRAYPINFGTSRGPADLESGYRTESSWLVIDIFVGSHFTEDYSWDAAMFVLPAFPHWISFLGDEITNPDESTGSISTQLESETITAWWTGLEAHLYSTISMQGTGGYAFESKGGMKLDRIDRWARALSNLHAILCGTPARYSRFTLKTSSDTGSVAVERVLLRSAEMPDRNNLTPFLGIRDIDFESFIPKWIKFHEDSTVWPTLGISNGASGYIEHEFLNAVSEAERIGRMLVPISDVPSTTERKILEKLGQAEGLLNRREFNKIKAALAQTRNKLAGALEGMANMSGDVVSRPVIEDAAGWAEAVSRARHALSHGLSSEYPSLASDPQALMDLTSSVNVVVQLVALRGCGYEYECDSEEPKGLATRFDTVRFKNANSWLGEWIDYTSGLSSIWTATSNQASADKSGG